MKKKPLNCFIVKMDGKYEVVDIDLSDYNNNLYSYILNNLYDEVFPYMESSRFKDIVIITDDACPGNGDYLNLASGDIKGVNYLYCSGNMILIKRKNNSPYEYNIENFKRLTKKDIKNISNSLDLSCKLYYDVWKKKFKGFNYLSEEVEL